MDFLEGLPTSQGKNVDMVVGDYYSKFANFVSSQHPFTAPKVAQLFFEEVFCLYDLLKSIVSDRDPIFISSFWSELFKLQGTQLNLSSFYHRNLMANLNASTNTWSVISIISIIQRQMIGINGFYRLCNSLILPGSRPPGSRPMKWCLEGLLHQC